MFSVVYNSPRGLRAYPPFSITSAASGISAVTTRSPGSTRLTISSSATSKPDATCTELIYRDGGTRIAWFATRVSRTLVRSAALNRISLITTGHASASTQIFNRAAPCLLFHSNNNATTSLLLWRDRGAMLLRFRLVLAVLAFPANPSTS